MSGAAKPKARWSHARQCWKVSRNMVLALCRSCGGLAARRMRGNRVHCETCGKHPYFKRQAYISQAHRAVARAIRLGQMPHPSTLSCTDCDRPAECYDHRDYDRPLDAEPVCRRCNCLRGPAKQTQFLTRIRPSQLVAPGGRR